MISKSVKKVLTKAIDDPEKYSKGSKRKTLQANFETLLGEISEYLFSETCSGRIQLRRRLNKLDINKLSGEDSKLVGVLLDALKHDELLYSKTYVDHMNDTEEFCMKHLRRLVSAATR